MSVVRDSEAVVYRMFDGDGGLLYVGCSNARDDAPQLFVPDGLEEAA